MRSVERDEASHIWIQAIHECDQRKDRVTDPKLDSKLQ